MIDYNNIPLDDERTWNLICAGDTIGCFQIESRLGRQFCKKAQPHSITELSDVISIIRPGVLEAKIDNKNIAEHYVDRKNGREEPAAFHPSLIPILKNTYNLLLYQEQTIKIGQELAGMDASVSDKLLRKGIAKKIPEVVAEAKKAFLDGCSQTGSVSADEAEEIFGWIEKGQRYLFNACLDPSTSIQSTRGTTTINKLQVGDHILAPSDDYQHVEYVEVTNIIDQGLQDVYEMELEDGSTIRCTLNHKFLASNNKILPLYEILDQNLSIVCHN